jgi:hypothetical protein
MKGPTFGTSALWEDNIKMCLKGIGVNMWTGVIWLSAGINVAKGDYMDTREM